MPLGIAIPMLFNGRHDGRKFRVQCAKPLKKHTKRRPFSPYGSGSGQDNYFPKQNVTRM